MRWTTTILVLVGILGVSGAQGQSSRFTRPGDRTIERHWPTDGAASPEPPRVSWDGDDAVGLQFREHNPTGTYAVPVSVLKLSSEALKEMRQSDKSLLAHDVRGSAEHLEKMLKLAPDFAIGHNSLGTRYVVLGEYDKAIAEFEKAVALEPKYRLAVDNIVVAMCIQHRYADAEPVARAALQIQPDAPSSKYLLGSILVSEDKATEEASRLLSSVQEKYPRARLFLAKAYVSHGDPSKAVEELRAYMQSPQATDNGVAEEWLNRLENELSAQPAVAAGDE